MWENRSMVSDAQARATAKYQKKTYDVLSFKVWKDSGDKARYQDYADSLDLTLASFMRKCIEYVIDNNIKLR